MLDEPAPSRPNGALAGPKPPTAFFFQRPRRLLTPVYWAVNALGLFFPLSQVGLFALNICTAPPGTEACVPLLAKLGGTFRVRTPAGSIDRTDPCWPPLAGSGAPKLDALPTRM